MAEQADANDFDINDEFWDDETYYTNTEKVEARELLAAAGVKGTEIRKEGDEIIILEIRPQYC